MLWRSYYRSTDSVSVYLIKCKLKLQLLVCSCWHTKNSVHIYITQNTWVKWKNVWSTYLLIGTNEFVSTGWTNTRESHKKTQRNATYQNFTFVSSYQISHFYFQPFISYLHRTVRYGNFSYGHYIFALLSIKDYTSRTSIFFHELPTIYYFSILK